MYSFRILFVAVFLLAAEAFAAKVCYRAQTGVEAGKPGEWAKKYVDYSDEVRTEISEHMHTWSDGKYATSGGRVILTVQPAAGHETHDKDAAAKAIEDMQHIVHEHTGH